MDVFCLFSLCTLRLGCRIVLKTTASEPDREPFDCRPQKSLRVECVVLCFVCLWSLVPKTKTGLICPHISSLAPSAVWCLTPAPIKDGTATYFQPFSRDLPPPMGSQVFQGLTTAGVVQVFAKQTKKKGHCGFVGFTPRVRQAMLNTKYCWLDRQCKKKMGNFFFVYL